MKRYLSLLLALVLLLPGCSKKQDNTTEQDAETILRVMQAGQEEKDSFIWYLESQDVEGYLADYYKLDGLNWSDGAIVRMDGARAFELAVLTVDEIDVETVAAALQEYLMGRRAAFTGYLPEEADMVDRALILTRGQWVAMIVCQYPETAKDRFENCFGEGVYAQGIPAILTPEEEDYRPDGRLIYKDPGIDDMTVFDNSAILAAWKSGDDSALSKADKEVLTAAKAVLEGCVTTDMADYDKELSLYAWLTTHVSYDQSHYSKKGAPRISYEPYGPLIKGKGVCLGYAAAFQLLMDMAGVECITVTGAAFQNRENHAWNMVKLNGEWYCADSTWDHINVDRDYPAEELRPLYNYFNVTSDYMAETSHQWNYDNTPEATAEDGGRP